jgi:predicted acylesterase/phospholipase RssA
MERDIAIVLSGGSINGVLLELGFLQRVRESELWPRVGWIFGTSAGALSGTMAALDRLDELEEFLLALEPDEAFRPNRLWQLPLLGTHEYALPKTIAERIGDLDELSCELGTCERELVVCATDVSDPTGEEPHDFELVYSSRTATPEELSQAILASAAISALVLPLPVGDRIATDGAWVRNFPLVHAYARPEVRGIVAFRYLPRYPRVDAGGITRLRARLERFRGVPPVRAFVRELREAEARDSRGEPPHLVDMIRRLMRIAVQRNTVMEERLADEKDRSVLELERLRHDLHALVGKHVRRTSARRALDAAIDERLNRADFPFGRDRALPRVTVRASVGAVSLEPSFRAQKEWTAEAKRSLIDRGYRLTDEELARHGYGTAGAVSAKV